MNHDKPVSLTLNMTINHMNKTSRWTALTSICAACLAFCLVTPYRALGAAPPGNLPAITAIQADTKYITVTVAVPAGVQQVVLESRTRLEAGAWVPRAVQQVNGASTLTFKLANSEVLEVLRVRADSQSTLPTAFYAGQTNFNGQVSTADPSKSAGNGTGVLAPTDAAGGVVTAAPTSDTTRTVVESDIWQIHGQTVYFFNQYRGLQVIDISQPDAPTVRSTLELPAAGEQMYWLDDQHVVLLARDNQNTTNGVNCQVLIVNVAGAPQITASLPLPGSIQESRLVGTALYVASQNYRSFTVASKPGGAPVTQWEYGTVVSSFDLAKPDAPVKRDSQWYAGSGNAIYATDQFLFVATQSTNNYWQSILNVVDISAPDGTMKAQSSVAAAGRVADKFKMHQSGAIFTVASEAWNSAGGTNRRFSVIQTFSLANPAAPQRLGYLEMGHGEGLYATRFDGDRIYVVTYLRIDPLWIVDVKDPAKPAIIGELQVPGWSTYIQPLGNHLVAIGVDNSNSWKVAVSLFDVTNPANPGLLAKVPLGDNYSWSEANYDEKALSVLPDAGLILVPYQGSSTNGWVSRVQLIELGANALKARGVIEHQMQPRRATVYANRILSISGRDFITVNPIDRDHPVVTADLELSWPVGRVCLAGDYLIEVSDSASWQGVLNPILRVVKANDSFTVLGRVELTNGLPVIGATVQDGHFYLAQGVTGYGIIPLPADNGSSGSNPTNNPNLLLSVYDLSHLPSFSLVGSTSVTVSNLGWSPSLAPLWLKTGLLVWSGGSGGFIFYGGIDSLAPVGMFRPWPWWGGSGSGHLLAFDVNNASQPKFLSEVDLTSTNQWWSFSPAYHDNGLVYLSHQGSQYIPPILAPGTGGTPDGSKTNQPPSGMWVTKYYLDVVDYADPANPTIRKPVNIPGQLQGLARSGNLIYTVGSHWNDQFVTDWSQYLDASGYDGVNAYLVDSLKLTNSWPSPVIAPDGTTYLIQTDANNNSQLQARTLSVAGKFSLLGVKPLPSQASSLKAFGNLLAVQMSQRINLYDITNPANVGILGGGDSYGWLYPSLNQADGVSNKGLWVPLQDYGVWGIPVGP